MRTRIPTAHARTHASSSSTNPVRRTPSPAFSPPVLSGMYDPVADVVTYLTHPEMSSMGVKVDARGG